VQKFQDSFDQYTDNNPISLVDLTQRIFSCCGVNSYADYTNKSVQIPASCKSGNATDVTELEGCRAVVLEKLNEKLFIMTEGFAIGAGAVMVSVWLCDAIILTYCDM